MFFSASLTNFTTLICFKFLLSPMKSSFYIHLIALTLLVIPLTTYSSRRQTQVMWLNT